MGEGGAMAEVSNELIYEVLKKVQGDIGDLKVSVGDVRQELQAIRGHIVAVQQDINNIYVRMALTDTRLDRIEMRLDLTEAPAS
jgi:predicted  nucleic acid-binding Zn-ribbon protein